LVVHCVFSAGRVFDKKGSVMGVKVRSADIFVEWLEYMSWWYILLDSVVVSTFSHKINEKFFCFFLRQGFSVLQLQLLRLGLHDWLLDNVEIKARGESLMVQVSEAESEEGGCVI